jgi:hypothetical protein
MATLEFDAADVKKIVEHALAAKKHHGTQDPALILVHDQGVYLMSNGVPTLPRPGNVTYAKGCYPERDPEWYDTAYDKVGGDDFAEFLPWCEDILQHIKNGAKVITFQITPEDIRLVYPVPRGPAFDPDKRKGAKKNA